MGNSGSLSLAWVQLVTVKGTILSARLEQVMCASDPGIMNTSGANPATMEGCD